ncbi:alpha/beta fold hydrolase [Polynucleobacter sp. UK-Gri1-W3]|uniref:alpha/beta fold hydrolase n=1 Tax=Polynucleobacter sp. UK-Gri1-W3 TaxID=1819737 RepID=UPI001C0D47D3|nr:alpha/beta fold hydrolase [Polynucleobacter sp. UK-Gri1-W3]
MKNIPKDWPNQSFSREIKTEDLSWHVQVGGNSPKHILMLHGTGSSAHTWGTIFTELAKNYTVAAPDLPGHGFTTSVTKKSFSLDELATQLTRLREGLGISYFDYIIGHSAGATLGLSYALINEQPKEIIGLNPSLITLPSFYQNFIAPLLNPIVTSSFFTSILSDLLPHTKIIDGLLDSTKTKLSPDKREKYKTLFNSADHLNGSMSFMAGTDIAILLKKCKLIKSKLTFILSEDDGWIPIKNLRDVIREYFDKAKVIELKGGHLFHEGDEEMALNLIQNALNKEEEENVNS